MLLLAVYVELHITSLDDAGGNIEVGCGVRDVVIIRLGGLEFLPTL